MTGYVHALTEQVCALDHNAAKIDCNAKVDAPVSSAPGPEADEVGLKPDIDTRRSEAKCNVVPAGIHTRNQV